VILAEINGFAAVATAVAVAVVAGNTVVTVAMETAPVPEADGVTVAVALLAAVVATGTAMPDTGSTTIITRKNTAIAARGREIMLDIRGFLFLSDNRCSDFFTPDQSVLKYLKDAHFRHKNEHPTLRADTTTHS
jgi:hypothetical protein